MNRLFANILIACVIALTIIGGCSGGGRGERDVLVAQNRMKQFALGLSSFEIVHRKLPAHAIYSKDGKPLLSWRVQILQSLEESDDSSLYDEFHLDEPW